MGVDVCIYCRTKNGEAPTVYSALVGVDVLVADDFAMDGATHEIETPWRYYGIGYERGPWSLISSVLLDLLSDENVEVVWYFGDCSDWADPFTADKLEKINRHYIEHGNRPYYGAQRLK